MSLKWFGYEWKRCFETLPELWRVFEVVGTCDLNVFMLRGGSRLEKDVELLRKWFDSADRSLNECCWFKILKFLGDSIELCNFWIINVQFVDSTKNKIFSVLREMFLFFFILSSFMHLNFYISSVIRVSNFLCWTIFKHRLHCMFKNLFNKVSSIIRFSLPSKYNRR